jgi:hypothetical protein
MARHAASLGRPAFGTEWGSRSGERDSFFTLRGWHRCTRGTAMLGRQREKKERRQPDAEL